MKRNFGRTKPRRKTSIIAPRTGLSGTILTDGDGTPDRAKRDPADILFGPEPTPSPMRTRRGRSRFASGKKSAADILFDGTSSDDTPALSGPGSADARGADAPGNGAQAPGSDAFDTSVKGDAMAIAREMVVNSKARNWYLGTLKDLSEEADQEYRRGGLTAQEAATKANAERNAAVLDGRKKGTTLGKAVAEKMKIGDNLPGLSFSRKGMQTSCMARTSQVCLKLKKLKCGKGL